MADKPISLSKVRKARARATAKQTADANAAKFGRTKLQKSQDVADAEKLQSKLDQTRRETDTPDD